MKTSTFLRSFAGGEIAPEMLGRIDAPQYQAGLRQCRDWVTTPQGTIITRAGFRHIAETKNGGEAVLLEFDAGPDDQCVVLVGAGWMRFSRDGALLSPGTVRAWQGNTVLTLPAASSTITWAGHTLADGDAVEFTGALPPQLSTSVTYYVVNALAGTIQVATEPGGTPITWTGGPYAPTGRRRYFLGHLALQGGVVYYAQQSSVNVTPPSIGVWHAMPAGILEIPNEYTAAQLPDLNYDQVNDIVCIAHPEQQARELRRYSDTFWTLTAVSVEPLVLTPSGLTATPYRPGRFVIASITTANPPVFSVKGGPAGYHGFQPNDPVWIENVVGTMGNSQLADGFFLIARVPGTEQFTVRRYDGTEPNTTGLGYTADSATVEYWARTSESSQTYVITAVDQNGAETAPTAEVSARNNLFADGSPANVLQWEPVSGAKAYKVYRRESGLFGEIGTVDTTVARRSGTITFTLGAAPLVLNLNAHPFLEGMPVRLSVSAGGALPTGGIGLSTSTTYYVRRTAANTFCLATAPDGQPIDGTAMVAGSGTYTCTERWWFRDDSIEIDLAKTPPRRTATDIVAATHYPAAVGHHEQRRWFGGELADPRRLLASRSGSLSDFAFRLPLLATDRIDWPLLTRRRAAIRHILPLGDLLVLTESAEFRVSAVGAEGLGPETMAVAAQSYVGCSKVRPQLVGPVILFEADQGGHIHWIGYSEERGGYRPADLSLRAPHLFDGLTIRSSAQSRAPYPIAWFVSSSGALLGCTFVPQEGVAGWHAHTTDGTFESIATERDDQGHDRVYAVVQRVRFGAPEAVTFGTASTITWNPNTLVNGDRVAFYGVAIPEGLEQERTYYVVNRTATTIQIALTAGGTPVTWTYPGFDYFADGRKAVTTRCLEYQDPPRIGALADWCGLDSAVTYTSPGTATLTGLGHLEGCRVKVIADGQWHPDRIVDGGQVVVQSASYAKVHVGRAYTPIAEPLPPTLQIAGYGQGRETNVVRADLRVEKATGVLMGPDQDHLQPAVPGEFSTRALQTSNIDMLLASHWRDDRMPLIAATVGAPARIVSLTLELAVGG